MLFVALEFIKWAEMRVGIGEVYRQAHCYKIVFHMVQKAATGRTCFTQWPARTVNHKPRVVFLWWDLPELLDAYAVVLWLQGVVIE